MPCNESTGVDTKINRMTTAAVASRERDFNRGGSGMQQLGFCHDPSIIADGLARRFSNYAPNRSSRAIWKPYSSLPRAVHCLAVEMARFELQVGAREVILAQHETSTKAVMVWVVCSFCLRDS
jgi:hypothetical protein